MGRIIQHNNKVKHWCMNCGDIIYPTAINSVPYCKPCNLKKTDPFPNAGVIGVDPARGSAWNNFITRDPVPPITRAWVEEPRRFGSMPIRQDLEILPPDAEVFPTADPLQVSIREARPDILTAITRPDILTAIRRSMYDFGALRFTPVAMVMNATTFQNLLNASELHPILPEIERYDTPRPSLYRQDSYAVARIYGVDIVMWVGVDNRITFINNSHEERVINFI